MRAFFTFETDSISAQLYLLMSVLLTTHPIVDAFCVVTGHLPKKKGIEYRYMLMSVLLMTHPVVDALRGQRLLTYPRNRVNSAGIF